MSITIEDLEGNSHEVYVAMEGGRVAAMIRCPTKEIFDATALSVGLLEYTNPAIPEVLDEEGNIVKEAVEASGPLIPSFGVTISRIGSLILIPGEYDSEGNEVVPPVKDDRYHVNFWLDPQVASRGLWKKWAIQWTLNGTPVADTNANESAKELNSVELIDPATVSSPSNVML